MRHVFLSVLLSLLCVGCHRHTDHGRLHIPNNLQWVYRKYDAESDSITSEKDAHVAMIEFQDPKTERIGFKNQKGDVVIPPRYRAVYGFNTYGIADVFTDYGVSGKWLKINTLGQTLVTPYVLDNGPDYYVSGLSRFEDNKKIGFVNLKGDIVVPAQFDWASAFWFSQPISVACVGCAPYKKDEHDEYPEIKGGTWGCINKKGQTVIAFDFEGYRVDTNGHVILLKKGQDYIIGTKGDGVFYAVPKQQG